MLGCHDALCLTWSGPCVNRPHTQGHLAAHSCSPGQASKAVLDVRTPHHITWANNAVLDVCAPAGQRSKEAEELLGRSFEVRQHNPVMFALLCDEITDAVVAGRMSEPLREWLKLSATDQLEGFLDDFTDSPADVQVCFDMMPLLTLTCPVTYDTLAGIGTCLDIGCPSRYAMVVACTLR